MSWEYMLLGWEALGRKLASKAFQWSAAAIVALFIPMLFAFGGIAFLFLVLAFGIWSTVLLYQVLEEIDAQLAGSSSRRNIPKKRGTQARRQAAREVEEELDRLSRKVEGSRNAQRRLRAAQAQIEADERGQLRSIIELEEKILTELGRPQDEADPLTKGQAERVQKLVDAAIHLSLEKIVNLNKIVSSSEEEIQAEIKQADAKMAAETDPAIKGNLQQLINSLRSELEMYRKLVADLRATESHLDLIESILWRIHFEPRTRQDAFNQALRVMDEVEGITEAQEMINSLR